MSALPDELWRRVLEIGLIETASLTYKDLCRFSITCRRLHRISGEDYFWTYLLSSHFPQQQQQQNPSSSSSSSASFSSANNSKTLYKIRYERDRERKLLAHRRAVLRIESAIAEHTRKIREIEGKSIEENERMNKTVVELMNLCRVRQASATLHVWQPEVVRGRQKHLIEQCDVPVDSRIHTLEMELRLCKQQIEGLEKAIRIEKRKLDAAKEQLASLQYHPLRNSNMKSSLMNGLGVRRKKMKTATSGRKPIDFILQKKGLPSCCVAVIVKTATLYIWIGSKQVLAVFSVTLSASSTAAPVCSPIPVGDGDFLEFLSKGWGADEFRLLQAKSGWNLAEVALLGVGAQPGRGAWR